jgi:ABC-2 type transport system permease protein
MNNSQESRDYIKAIHNTTFFDVKYYLTSYDQTVDFLDKNKTRLVITIPPDFSRKVSELLPARIQSLVDGSFANSARFIVNYLSGINAEYSSKLASEFIKKNGINSDPEPVNLAVRFWYNQSLRESTFKITGVFSLVIMAFVPILTALAIVREKESGSIQQIFVSPLKSHEYIAGKMAPYVIFLTLDYLLVIIFGTWWFGLPIRGNIPALFVATFLMVFATVAIGFFISTWTSSQLSAMLLSVVFTLMPAFIFGDSIFPVANMPEGWRLYASLFPAKYYTGILRAIMLRGANVVGYWEDGLSLVGYCAAIFFINTWRVGRKAI